MDKDIILDIRPSQNLALSGLARDLFRAWYPHRPLLLTHTCAPLYSLGDRPRRRPKRLPTAAYAYAILQQGFCIPMKYTSVLDNDQGLSLSSLIEHHLTLTHLLETEIEDILVQDDPRLRKDWSKGLIGLGGGFADGFCIYENTSVIPDSRFPGEKRDLRDCRELRVVGRENWVQRGWGDNNDVSVAGWTEVKELSDDERWLTGTMKLQQAVEGVIKASGEEGRFEEKAVSEYFQREFLEVPYHSDENIKELKRKQDELTAKIQDAYDRAVGRI